MGALSLGVVALALVAVPWWWLLAVPHFVLAVAGCVALRAITLRLHRVDSLSR
ncbi:hypothetical protein QRX60_31660 [Amycolatopsis mongoliensis]|uniref:Uncharacterized protein n=1 Tax=Amycolatopsis mongoliensis TaxID=715475 RepID=A0A9Y2JKN6_9PSEU|nr:hypothetical protein [Amycolatopsis sp. 4-36]WIX98608.1 hypothetical protein QRX60_31660 [Amycolatopsis sp. 4-36]